MFAKNYHLHWITGKVNILCKNLIYVFLNFGRDFCSFFTMLFPEAPASCGKKKIEIILAPF